MGRSWNIGTYFNIPVKIHWSFGFILIYLGYQATSEGWSLVQFLSVLLFTLSVFFCIVLHEYGHALMARYYKVKTKDIIVFPIGGVARLEKIPTVPKQELLVAIAGPLVNVVIGVLGLLFFFLLYGLPANLDFIVNGEGIKFYLLLFIYVNGFLFLFNLIPAFPMDGGRILRALLSYKFGLGKATQIATHVARVLAVGFVLYGLYDFHLIRIGIGIFVFMASGSENNHTQFNLKIQNTSLDQLDKPAAVSLLFTDTMDHLFQLYQQGIARNFLVCNQEDQIVGTMPELFIKRYLENDQPQPEDAVGQWMSKKFLILDKDTSVLSAAQQMNKVGVAIAALRNTSDDAWLAVDRDLLGQFAQQ